jgi:predicted TIM-barrel fold metal-dependent hydrolase
VSEPFAAGWDCHVHVFDASLASRSGHYRPVDRPLAQIEAVALAHGVGRLVLVQPSVYGTDNSLMLRALAAEPGRHRGVAVVDDDIPDAELDVMHLHGVRGVRFNLVSPVGERTTPAQRYAALAPRLRRRGWHVQWYAGAAELPSVAELHRDSGLTCVLDHLAGFGSRVAIDDPAWQAAEALAAQGAWLKLSGWYRLDAQAPYTVLVPNIHRLAGLFGARMVWGSDWPHTLFAPDAMPSYGSTWQPVVEALGRDAAEALRRRRPAIYQ